MRHVIRSVALVAAFAGSMLLAPIAGCRSSAGTKAPSSQPVAAAATPPKAEKRPHTTSIHGQTLVDNYFWLRNKEDPAVIRHLEQENAYTASLMDGTKPLQQRLYDEMLGRIQQTDTSAPYRDNGYWYYSRTVEGKAYPIYCRRPGAMEAPEQIVLDVNAEAVGKPFLLAHPIAYSNDNRIMAWGADTTGGRKLTVRFRDLTTGADLPDVLEGVPGDLEFASDCQTYYYATMDSALRNDKILRNRLGAPVSQAKVLLHETDELFDVSVSLSRSRRFIITTSTSFDSTECRIISADDPGGELRLVEPRHPKLEYHVDHQGDRLLIMNNGDAINFKLDVAPIDNPARANWKPLIPHDPETFIEGIECFKDWLIVNQRRGGLPQVRVIRIAGGEEHVIAHPEPSYDVGPDVNAEYDTQTFRFNYSSPITPRQVIDYDMAKRTSVLVKEQPVLGGYDRTNYMVERAMAPAPDGQLVPVTILRRKDTKLGGTGSANPAPPALLYAYGSYGLSTDANFRSNVFSLVDRGFVYAIAHIRGGSEKGRTWYEQGRLMHKRNTFTDFIAAAEYLVKNGYTSPERLAINGGSAGGLLMGAVVNMRPDLFAVCVADVPFVDVINTMLDDSLPLTVPEYEQWGNPHEREAFEYIASYSPYDNVKPQSYPAILSMTSLNDTNVCYWEPAKWVARLRDVDTSTKPVALHVNMDAGHGGASDRYEALRETAFRYAFILSQLGMAK